MVISTYKLHWNEDCDSDDESPCHFVATRKRCRCSCKHFAIITEWVLEQSSKTWTARKHLGANTPKKTCSTVVFYGHRDCINGKPEMDCVQDGRRRWQLEAWVSKPMWRYQNSWSLSSICLLGANNFPQDIRTCNRVTHLLWHYVLRQVCTTLDIWVPRHKIRCPLKSWKHCMTKVRTLSKVCTALPVDRKAKKFD